MFARRAISLKNPSIFVGETARTLRSALLLLGLSGDRRAS
jgi:hypothetical protein